MFIATEHLDRLKDNYLEGAADLVIAIISPESEERDRGKKFTEYEASGAAEYWLVDPIRHNILAFSLDVGRHYQSLAVDSAGALHSRAVPGFQLRVALLWDDVTEVWYPRIFDLAQEMLKQTDTSLNTSS